MRIAIVTGASSGIGSEFCKALDKEGLDYLWLVARREDRLNELAKSLRTPCRIVPADLTDMKRLSEILEDIKESGCIVQYLVNCAGFGLFGKTTNQSVDSISGMIDLNCTALAILSSGCIPFMQNGSSIIQLCSASAYLPLEYLNVYSSSKAFVRSFCIGLRSEIAGSGINVLEVSPGWVSTDFIEKSISEYDVPAKVFSHTVTKEMVVKQAMIDLRKGKKRSICGFYNKFQMFACIHMPRIAMIIWSRSLSS